MNIQTIINSVPPELWAALFAGGGVSIAAQFGKKVLSLESPKVIMLLTTVLSALAAFIPVLLSAASANPGLLGKHAIEIIGVATLLYRYVIQPFDGFLVNYKQFKASQSTSPAFAKPVETTTTVAAPANEFIG